MFTAWLAIILAIISFYYEVIEPRVHKRWSQKSQQSPDSIEHIDAENYGANIRLKFVQKFGVFFRPLNPTKVQKDGVNSLRLPRNKNGALTRWKLESGIENTRNRRIRVATENVLMLLIDLQIVTCLAIMIAGTSQLATMSFYHQALMSDYWMLTLNSLWAAGKATGRPIKVNHSSLQPVQEALRDLLVIAFLVLASFFSVKTNLIFNREWDFLSSGKCFRYGYESPISSWFWTAGLLINLALYLLSMSSYSWAMVQSTGKLFEHLRAWVDRKYESIFEGIDELLLKFEWRVLAQIISIGQKACRNGLHFLRWTIVQLFAILVSGEGDFRVQAPVLLVFYCLATADIIDLKLRNLSLIGGTESSWPFGQVLAVSMLFMVALNFVDSFVEEGENHTVEKEEDTELESLIRGPL